MVWRVETEEGHLIQNEQNSSPIYQFFQIGLLKFDKPGKHTVSVSFIEGEMNTASLQKIKMIPILN